MDQRAVVAIVVIAAVVIVLALVWFAIRKRRTEALRRRFGPEYERVALEQGASRADTILAKRERRVEKLPLRRLALDERERFITEWRQVQGHFVDDPAGAVTEADLLVGRLMEARGYPLGDFEQRAADISVDHPRVVENYRAAHEIALRHRNGEASTEDLRSSMIYYRSLFDDLLETSTAAAPVATTTRREVA
jgi:hypothetical protein